MQFFSSTTLSALLPLFGFKCYYCSSVDYFIVEEVKQRICIFFLWGGGLSNFVVLVHIINKLH